MNLNELGQKNLDEIVDSIATDMENHDVTKPYEPRWVTKLHGNILGYKYTGFNQFHLNMKYGDSTPLWGTYFQYNKLGLHPRKGTGKPLWQPTIRKEKDKKTGEEKVIPGFKTIAIFNIDEVDGNDEVVYNLKDQYLPKTKYAKIENYEEVDSWVDKLDATIEHGSNMACYIPASDRIKMPLLNSFVTREHYYATLFHEITHWTGHSSRCNRKLSGKYGASEYAFEELIAELGASFHMASWNLFHTTRMDHVHYLKSWAKALRDKPDSLRKACKYASESYFYLQHDSLGSFDNAVNN